MPPQMPLCRRLPWRPPLATRGMTWAPPSSLQVSWQSQSGATPRACAAPRATRSCCTRRRPGAPSLPPPARRRSRQAGASASPTTILTVSCCPRGPTRTAPARSTFTWARPSSARRPQRGCRARPSSPATSARAPSRAPRRGWSATAAGRQRGTSRCRPRTCPCRRCPTSCRGSTGRWRPDSSLRCSRATRKRRAAPASCACWTPSW
mmetsp:Transcript_8181/g.26350  ORF Transcript_8181/g.26350 Transcript_8181/m.26350 type:complete len:207 (-) Transcript_8181:445-1065(-)